jgi:hypothetical protein
LETSTLCFDSCSTHDWSSVGDENVQYLETSLD